MKSFRDIRERNRDRETEQERENTKERELCVYIKKRKL